MHPSTKNAPATKGALVLLGFPLLFVLCMLPTLAEPAAFHGDERFYTDAAVQMLETGDWWTPKYADGALRLNKPLLTYWLIGGSYWCFGVSLLTSRLPFLLLGALLIYLTERLSLVLTRDTRGAVLAGGILAANSGFVALATRATPDIPLACAIGVALLGLTRMLAPDRERGAERWLVWAGLGGAVAAKGALALVVLLFVLLMLALDPRRRALLRELVRPDGVAVGIALALAGTLPMLLLHREQALATAFEDQVGGRAPPGLGFVADNFVNYWLDPFKLFLPFSAFAALAYRRGGAGSKLLVRSAFLWLGLLYAPRITGTQLIQVHLDA